MGQLNFSGADLSPLAHESSCSSLLRLSWINAFDEKVLAELLGINRIYRSQTFANLGWISNNSIASTLGWKVPCQEELEALGEFNGLSSVFFASKFRICPLCISAIYHSYWHQFNLINECPVHKTPLVDECMACGESLPDYSLNKHLFGKAYYCHHCKHPISGKKPMLKDHFQLRISSNLLVLHFGRLHSILQDNLDTVSLLKSLNNFDGGTICGDSNSFDANFLTREILLNAAGGHRVHLIARRSPITVLSWKVRFPKNDREAKYFRRVSASVIERSGLGVYRSTIRYLRDWIVKVAASDEMINDIRFEHTEGVLQIGNRSSYGLAYHLTRMSFEDYGGEPLSENIRFFGLKLDEVIPNYSYAGRQPKLAWRAIFFAVFASMFWRVEYARKEGGSINLRAIRTRTDPSVAKAVFRLVDNVLSGYVIFPTVPLMPTSPFKNTRLGVNTHFHEFQSQHTTI